MVMLVMLGELRRSAKNGISEAWLHTTGCVETTIYVMMNQRDRSIGKTL